ncbi:MAG: hypothetical protein AAFZ07_27095 [Actinomycetota bacterium]
MRVDVLPTNDEAGAELAEAVWAALPGHELRLVPGNDPFSIVRSVAAADAVVLDLTPAEEGVHRYTTMAYPWRNDHVLAVSRTYLPINVWPRRRGGAAVSPGSRSVAELTDWIVGQVGSLGRHSRWRRALGAVAPGAVGGPTSTADAFISYRRQQFAIAAELRDELGRGEHHGGRPQRVQLLEPGGLTSGSAILPPMLRWNLVSIISDLINEATEFWVVGPVDHYLGSWWTQAELLCRPYWRDRAVLRVLDPVTGEISHGHELLPAVALGQAERKRLARLFTNSHPDMMAPERLDRMRQLRTGRGGFADDPVFDEEAWTVPLLECSACSGTVEPHVDVAAFVANEHPRLHPVEPHDLERHAAAGSILACPDGCGNGYRITPLPPAYLWHAKGPKALEPITVFAATSIR